MSRVTGSDRNVSPVQVRPEISDFAAHLGLGIVLVPH